MAATGTHSSQAWLLTGTKGDEGSHTRLLTGTKEQPRTAADGNTERPRMAEDGDKGRAAKGGPSNGA